jgi:very-short-patch-repair endonuclease
VQRGGGKFCSQKCYGLHQRLSPHGGNGTPAKPRPEVTCKVCGMTFRARGKRSYCSLECRKSVTHVLKTCPQCKRDFDDLRCVNKTHCSDKCLRASRRSKNCQRCGTVMKTGQERLKHCSEECRRPPVFIRCETCGNTRRVVPVYAEQRFCSFRCYRRFTGETVPERNARLSLSALKVKFIQEHPIGRYSVDFYLPDKKMVVEIDEPYWHEKMKDRDAKKDRFLFERGYDVRRITATPLYGKHSSAITSFMRETITMPLFAPSFCTEVARHTVVPSQDLG